MKEIEEKFTEEVQDAFLELTNIGIGKAASAMSELVDRHLQITVPHFHYFQVGEGSAIPEFHLKSTVQVLQVFSGMIEGRVLLVLSKEGAVRLASMLLDEDVREDAFGETEQSAILELGNIMIGGLMGSLSNSMELSLNYEPPEIQMRGDDNLALGQWKTGEPLVVVIKATLTIDEEDVSSYLILLVNLDNFHKLLDCLIAQVS